MNYNQITNWIVDLFTEHPAINETTLLDINEVQINDELNTHCYIGIDPIGFDPNISYTSPSYSVLILTNSTKERTQIIQSLNETISIAQEVLTVIQRSIAIEEVIFEPHIQNDDYLAIGIGFTITLKYKSADDYCETPFGEKIQLINDKWNIQTQ